MGTSFLKISALVLVLIFCWACKNTINGSDFERDVLEQSDLIRDASHDSSIAKVVSQINCIANTHLKRKLVFSDEFDPNDKGLILVIPFRTVVNGYKSSAYSDVDNHFILINPGAILDFTKRNTLSDSTSLPGVMGLMFLHEFGHFALGKKGFYDNIEEKPSALGELRSNTQPEILTANKRIELSADSLAVHFIKTSVLSKETDCFNIAFETETILPGLEFMLFGKRTIENFGSPSAKLLHDPSSSHPNLELRIAFMNYFLTGLPEKRQMIDDYLYEREVATVHRQETDPRIYQGDHKKDSTPAK